LCDVDLSVLLQLAFLFCELSVPVERKTHSNSFEFEKSYKSPSEEQRHADL
jgi:hypothetical protein